MAHGALMKLHTRRGIVIALEEKASINGVVVTWVVAIDPPGVRFPLNASNSSDDSFITTPHNIRSLPLVVVVQRKQIVEAMGRWLYVVFSDVKRYSSRVTNGKQSYVLGLRTDYSTTFQ